MSPRKLEWSHTPASAPGCSICISSAETPPIIIEVKSPWTFRQADPGG
jgi:hypothetical protein